MGNITMENHHFEWVLFRLGHFPVRKVSTFTRPGHFCWNLEPGRTAFVSAVVIEMSELRFSPETLIFQCPAG